MAVQEKAESDEVRRKHHSKELLQPPKGPGVAFLLEELRKEKGPLKTFKVKESSVLSRARSLLPRLEEAERELRERLQREPPENIDIEHVAEGETCIEMDLAVVPLPPTASDTSPESSDSDSDSSSSCSNHSYEDRFPLKLQPSEQKRRRVDIEELQER